MTLALPSRRITPAWVRDGLWRRARAVPSLDLRFAESKSLVDAVTGQNLITFTRASGGTYTDSQGVLRQATTNLLLRSEGFDDASWTKAGASVTANAITAPNGTLGADQLVEDTSTGGHLILQTITATNATSYTFSVYLRKSGRRYAGIVFSAAAATLSVLGIDFDTGQIVTISGLTNATGTIASVDGGWFRVTATTTSVAAGAFDCNVRPFNGTSWSDRNYTGDGTSGIYLWGAQLEQSSTVGEYIPTGATINSAPRFDHNPTTGESLGLLVEEQRQNLLLQSEDFAATWDRTQINAFGSGSIANATTAPDGLNTADLISVVNGQTLGATGFIGQNITKSATAITYTLSIFAKREAFDSIALFLHDASNFTNRASVTASLATGAITGSASAAGTFSAPSSVLTPFPSGWYRLSLTATSGTETLLRTRIYVRDSIAATGDGASGIYIWGAQLEAGAFPTSYIPTTGSAATRNADVVSITGTNFSSWYRQDEGTMFAEAVGGPIPSGGFPIMACFEGATNAERIQLVRYGVGQARPSIVTGSVVQSAFDLLPAWALGSTGKMALGLIVDNVAGSANGGAVVTDNTAAVPSLTQLRIGAVPANAQYYNGHLRRLTYWPLRLPNATLQSITQ